MKLAAFTIGGLERASSRLRSYHLFENAKKVDLNVIRPKKLRDALTCDFVHIQKIISYKIIFSILIFRLFKIKVIYDIDDQPESSTRFLLYWLALFFSTVITVDTEERMIYWLTYLPFKRIVIINDIADVDDSRFIAVENVKKNNNSFFWIGYPENLYSLNDLLKTIAQNSSIKFIASTEFHAIEKLKTEYPFVDFLPWHNSVAFEDKIDSKFMVLNHKLNKSTQMKSDNKMVLAILSGYIPLVSSTPSYTRLASQLNAEFLLYESQNEILNIASKLENFDFISFLTTSMPYLIENYSKDAVMKKFIKTVLHL